MGQVSAVKSLFDEFVKSGSHEVPHVPGQDGAPGPQDAEALLVRHAAALAAPLKNGDRICGDWHYSHYDVPEQGFLFTRSGADDRLVLILRGGGHGPAADGSAGAVPFELAFKKPDPAPDRSGDQDRRERDSATRIIGQAFHKLVSRTPAPVLKRYFWLRDLVRLNADNWSASSGVILRLSDRCNQQCVFCPILDNNTTRIDDHEQVLFSINYLRWRGVARIIFSGGEPTLNPHLPQYIRAAQGQGACCVEIQTNGIRLADAGYAAALKSAGLSAAMISLHAHTAEVSESITNAPGTFRKQLQGIRNALNEHLSVNINCVICEANYRDLRAYLRFLHEALPRVPELITFSFVAPAFEAWESAPLIPRISHVLPFLYQSLEFAGEIGMRVNIPSICGIPYCMMGPFAHYHEESARESALPGPDKEKPASCAPCGHFGRCNGIWKKYALLHGTDEFKPMR